MKIYRGGSGPPKGPSKTLMQQSKSMEGASKSKKMGVNVAKTLRANTGAVGTLKTDNVSAASKSTKGKKKSGKGKGGPAGNITPTKEGNGGPKGVKPTTDTAVGGPPKGTEGAAPKLDAAVVAAPEKTVKATAETTPVMNKTGTGPPAIPKATASVEQQKVEETKVGTAVAAVGDAPHVRTVAAVDGPIKEGGPIKDASTIAAVGDAPHEKKVGDAATTVVIAEKVAPGDVTGQTKDASTTAVGDAPHVKPVGDAATVVTAEKVAPVSQVEAQKEPKPAGETAEAPKPLSKKEAKKEAQISALLTEAKELDAKYPEGEGATRSVKKRGKSLEKKLIKLGVEYNNISKRIDNHVVPTETPKAGTGKPLTKKQITKQEKIYAETQVKIAELQAKQKPGKPISASNQTKFDALKAQSNEVGGKLESTGAVLPKVAPLVEIPKILTPVEIEKLTKQSENSKIELVKLDEAIAKLPPEKAGEPVSAQKRKLLQLRSHHEMNIKDLPGIIEKSKKAQETKAEVEKTLAEKKTNLLTIGKPKADTGTAPAAVGAPVKTLEGATITSTSTEPKRKKISTKKLAKELEEIKTKATESQDKITLIDAKLIDPKTSKSTRAKLEKERAGHVATLTTASEKITAASDELKQRNDNQLRVIETSKKVVTMKKKIAKQMAKQTGVRVDISTITLQQVLDANPNMKQAGDIKTFTERKTKANDFAKSISNVKNSPVPEPVKPLTKRKLKSIKRERIAIEESKEKPARNIAILTKKLGKLPKGHAGRAKIEADIKAQEKLVADADAKITDLDSKVVAFHEGTKKFTNTKLKAVDIKYAKNTKKKDKHASRYTGMVTTSEEKLKKMGVQVPVKSVIPAIPAPPPRPLTQKELEGGPVPKELGAPGEGPGKETKPVEGSIEKEAGGPVPRTPGGEGPVKELEVGSAPRTPGSPGGELVKEATAPGPGKEAPGVGGQEVKTLETAPGVQPKALNAAPTPGPGKEAPAAVSPERQKKLNNIAAARTKKAGPSAPETVAAPKQLTPEEAKKLASDPVAQEAKLQEVIAVRKTQNRTKMSNADKKTYNLTGLAIDAAKVGQKIGPTGEPSFFQKGKLAVIGLQVASKLTPDERAQVSKGEVPASVALVAEKAGVKISDLNIPGLGAPAAG
jgi:hypothetical protein